MQAELTLGVPCIQMRGRYYKTISLPFQAVVKACTHVLRSPMYSDALCNLLAVYWSAVLAEHIPGASCTQMYCVYLASVVDIRLLIIVAGSGKGM